MKFTPAMTAYHAQVRGATSPAPRHATASGTHGPAPLPVEPAVSLAVEDVYYLLFRHKGKIALCALAGLIGSALFLAFQRPLYSSMAKLFIRYVVVEGRAGRATGDDTTTKSPDRGGETILSSEQEILTSHDLARSVAKAVGPTRILAAEGGGDDLERAANVVTRGLVVSAPKSSSVLAVTFQHQDATLVQPVLQAVLDQYLRLHVEVHRSTGMVGDFLAQETDQLRTRLAQTEEELRKARAKAGILAPDDARRALSEQSNQLRQQLFSARAEYTQREQQLRELTRHAASLAEPVGASDSGQTADLVGAPLPLDAYRQALERAELLRRREMDLQAVFTRDSPRLLAVEAQKVEANAAVRRLEEANPGLLATPRTSLSSNPASAANDQRLLVEREQVALKGLEARIETLTTQLDSVRAESTRLDSAEGAIQELARRKDLEEANYRRYAASLEQSRINEALSAGRVSNISVIQAPAPPSLEPGKTARIAGGIAGAGLALGLVWAFLIERVLDQSVRRPRELERLMPAPLFLSLPASPTRSTAAAPETALAPYFETLRDRLIGYCESRHLRHKPKLIGLTGLAPGAGVTTIAGGLARCLSEAGEGDVLLVDLTPGQGSARHFHGGKSTCSLDEIMSDRESAQVQERLFVVAEGTSGDALSRILPQRFFRVLSDLKASDFDYIIFDLPPVSQISITPRIASYLDLLLLVVESERTAAAGVQRAARLLADSEAHLGTVLNKTRQYVPSKLLQDISA
jgi:uncharacterized protein involved in exopolysaccharide biosynthesis/Mrp family chromosome partitioning ATPase